MDGQQNIKNVEKYGRARQATDDSSIRRVLFSCCITKATDTHSEYVTLLARPWQQGLRERLNVTLIYSIIIPTTTHI